MGSITNTTLEISMLVIPVGLFKMSEGTDVKLDRASKAGNRIARKEVDSVTGEVVTSDTVQRGRFTDNGFHAISKSDLDAIENVTRIDSLSIEDFVPKADVPFSRVTGAYYIVPQAGVSAKPLRLLYEALAETDRAGVFKLVMRTRQHLAVIYVEDGALYINTLAFASDFKRSREAKEVIAATEKPTAAMIKQAVALVKAYASDASVIDSMEDDLIPLKQELVTQALAGKKITKRRAATKKVATTDAFEEALRESVKQAQAKRSKQKVKV